MYFDDNDQQYPSLYALYEIDILIFWMTIPLVQS